MERTLTITTGASQYLQSALDQARLAQAQADGAYTGLIRQLGIDGPAALIALRPTELVVDVPDAPDV